MLTPPSHPDVVVVDDDPAVRSTIRAMLEMSGSAVVEAADAFEAFEALSERPSIETAIIDVRMPGLGGVELAAVIGEMRPNVSVVIISGASAPPGRELRDRMVFLPKPFSGQELAEAISSAQARTQKEP